MNVLSIFSNIIKPVFDGVFKWKSEENKMELSRQEFELMKTKLEADIEIRLAEEMHKPESEFRSFILEYEGKSGDQSSFMRGFRSSVRPVITYWSLLIITLIMFGAVSGDKLKRNLEAIPDPLWQIFLAIFGFWFGGRAFMQIAETWKQGETNKEAVTANAKVEEEKAKTERIKAEITAKKINKETNKAPESEDLFEGLDDFWGN